MFLIPKRKAANPTCCCKRLCFAPKDRKSWRIPFCRSRHLEEQLAQRAEADGDAPFAPIRSQFSAASAWANAGDFHHALTLLQILEQRADAPEPLKARVRAFAETLRVQRRQWHDTLQEAGLSVLVQLIFCKGNIIVNMSEYNETTEEQSVLTSIRQTLRGKEILLGVTGSIAAYKAADLCSRLGKLGANIHVALTPAAAQFVGAATFRALTRNPVVMDVFDEPADKRIAHIDLAQSADLVSGRARKRGHSRPDGARAGR